METVNGSQVVYEVRYGTPGIYLTPFKLILEEPWSKYHDINKTEEMSKRYYNKKKKMATAVMTDEQIKAVMDLYKPNFVQKLFMKYYSPIETTNIVRNTSIILVLGLIISGGIFGSLAEVIVGASLGLVLMAGEFYHAITNRKRVEQLMSVLSMTPQEINALESKYYLS